MLRTNDRQFGNCIISQSWELPPVSFVLSHRFDGKKSDGWGTEHGCRDRVSLAPDPSARCEPIQLHPSPWSLSPLVPDP